MAKLIYSAITSLDGYIADQDGNRLGGPDLAAQAIKAGLVDEFHVFVTPVVVGGGKQFLPDDQRRAMHLLAPTSQPRPRGTSVATSRILRRTDRSRWRGGDRVTSCAQDGMTKDTGRWASHDCMLSAEV